MSEWRGVELVIGELLYRYYIGVSYNRDNGKGNRNYRVI